MSTPKRLIFLILGLVAVLGLGVIAYVYFFTSSTPADIGATPNFPSAGNATSTTQTPSGGSLGQGSVSAPVSVSSRLIQISAGPTVPGVAISDSTSSRTSSSTDITVRFIDRQSGNVFSYQSQNQSLTRINNKTVPGIQSAAWLPDGSSALVRFLSGDDLSIINTYSLSAASSTGFFLSQGIADVAVSSAGILTVSSNQNGSVLALLRFDGTRSSTILTTPLSQIRAAFAGKKQYLLFTKPSASTAGHAYLVDSLGRLSRIARSLNGLVVLPNHTGSMVLASYTVSGLMQTELIDVATGVTTPLPVATIADKCAWTADDSAIYCGVPLNASTAHAYPDDWYQGTLSFSDRIWKIDVAGRYAQLVLDFPSVNKGTLDAEALMTDQKGTVLVFTNKVDGSLWSYAL